MTTITELDYVPDQLLDLPARRLHEIFSEPTLIHLSGRRKEPLFVSVLLHGNEDSGFIAIKQLLKSYSQKKLPRSLSIFIGNIKAAKYQKRYLDDQPDYNRIWKAGETPEQKMTQQIVEIMRKRKVFASIDIHNNTGINPHYACITELDQQFFHLATLFSRTVVYFTKPEGTQTSAFAKICPATAVECGLPEQPFGVRHALNFLEGCLHLDHFPDTPIHKYDMELFHTVAIIKIPANISFGFNSDDVLIRFRKDLDHLNFSVLPPGTELAHITSDEPIELEAWDETGHDVRNKYFIHKGNSICTAQEVMPSMLTLNSEIISQDCLCYFMERYHMD